MGRIITLMMGVVFLIVAVSLWVAARNAVELQRTFFVVSAILSQIVVLISVIRLGVDERF